MPRGQKNNILQTGRIAYGFDSTDYQAIKTDTSGQLLVVLAAGTASAGQVNAVLLAGTALVGNIKDADATYTTPTHSVVTAGTASGVALAANTARIYAAFVNDSDTDMYFKLGAAAVVNQGIRVNAAGGSYEMSRRLGNLFAGSVNVRCASSAKVLLVTEGV